MAISFVHFIQSLAFGILLHPLHVSVTEIKYDESEKELEVVMRAFIDDMEETLRIDLKQPELDILHPKNGLTTDQMVASYLQKHFAITVDNKRQPIQYIGHEREGEAFIFYIGVNNIKKLKVIEVSNSVLTDLFDDQSNLVHVTVRGVVKSLRLDRHTSTQKLTFE